MSPHTHTSRTVSCDTDSLVDMQRRAATECPAAYQLCPASVGGGCCPSDRVCGTSSCFATTAAPQSACGILGYIACGIEDGGGCCPGGYSCLQDGCAALPGVSYSETCDVGSYLCPASLNYGCCQSGMGCGLTDCYYTSATTFTMTETFTTTTDSQTFTITTTVITAATPQAPTPLPTSTPTASFIAKIDGSAAPIAKISASSTPNSGLTMPQIGGIIGGAVFLLLVILVAAFVIIRRLNQAIKLSDTSPSKKTLGYASNSRRSRGSYPLNSSTLVDEDAISSDPFQMNAPHGADQGKPHSQSYQDAGQIYSPELDGMEISPSIFTTPFPISHARGYNSLPTSDADPRSARTISSYNYPRGSRGYFDIPPHRDPVLRDQNIRWGHTSPRRPSQRGRNMSDVSDFNDGTTLPGHGRNLSDASDATIQSYFELEAGSEGDRRGSFQRAMHGLGLARLRRKSEPVVLGERPLLGSGNGHGTRDSIGMENIEELRESSVHELEFEDVSLGR